ncbi:MAG: conjugal transfer protein TraF [Porphyromonadaceae bacterium]|nr:conjugal transfer protein TraF [Porphyromonadaceae bacterium]
MLSPVLYAQINVNSPYSRYGYGVLDNHTVGASRAMAGIGYAIQSGREINIKNPASYAAIDTLTFLCDFGVKLQINDMKEGSTSEKQTNWSFEYFALQFPLAKWLATSIGVIPYSTVGYDYTGSINNGTARQTGEGSLNQAYVGLGAFVFKGFTVGLNFNYLFGEISNTSTSVNDIDATSYSIFDNTIHISDYRFEIGAQYVIRSTEKNRIVIGAVFSPGKQLLGKAYTTGRNYNVSSATYTYYQNDSIKLKESYSLAPSYGAGVAYTYDERLTIGVDFTYQPWSKAKFENSTDYFNDYFNAAIGAELLPRIYSNNFFQSVRYRAGVSIGRSYAKINGENELWEAGVTAGLGVPMKRNKSIVNITFGYTNRYTTPTKLITENEFKISLGLTFNEMWFYKSRLH